MPENTVIIFGAGATKACGGPQQNEILRDAYDKTMNDEALIAEAKRRKYEFDPVGGEELQALSKELTSQPPEVVDQLKRVLSK